MQNVQLINSSNATVPLKRFYADENGQIVLFHDSTEVLAPLFEAGVLNERSIVFLSASWYVSRHVAGTYYKKAIDAAQASVGTRFSVAKNIVIVANSKQEEGHFREIVPVDIDVIVANNTFLIDTEMFKIKDVDKRWLCAFNAKAYAFKRLCLSADVPNKVFITYDNAHEESEGRTERVRLEDYGDSTIFKAIPQEKVSEILNQAHVGAILSEVEGACNANTEYLLCGLPVVSTPSRGGRDVFYDEHTAIICEPNATSVARAVVTAADKLKSGEFSPTEIRRRTLERIEDYRDVFIESLGTHARRLGIQASMRDYFNDCIRDNGKLISHRNFWIKDIRRGSP